MPLRLIVSTVESWSTHSYRRCLLISGCHYSKVIIQHFRFTSVKFLEGPAPSNTTSINFFSVLLINPTRCTNFSDLFLEWNSTCFGQFLCPSSGVFHCTHSNNMWHTDLLTACKLAPKHVEFHSKNKFEKLVHLVGFYYKNSSRSTVTWTSNSSKFLAKHRSSTVKLRLRSWRR